MRNCKSRTKRVGGGLLGDGSCLNCSPEKKKFKRLKYDMGTVQDMEKFLRNLSVEQINLLYNELNDRDDKPEFIRRLAEIYKTEEGIPKGFDEQIKARIIVVMKDEAEAQVSTPPPQSFDDNAFNSEAAAPAQPSAPTLDSEHVEVTDPSTGKPGMQRVPIKGPGGGFKNPRIGGKSRRRHRRGRTLHKRRKSSKVRKMRYSRTHSRR
jgi:hypothetical protein